MRKLLHVKNFPVFVVKVSSLVFYLLLIPYPLSLFYSCNSPTSNNPPVQKITKAERKVTLIQLLLGDGNNEFRNVNLGIDSKTVLKAEAKIADENDTDNIYYTFPIDTIHPDSVNDPIDSANYFNITYNFDKDKLNEIDEDVLTSNDSTAALLIDRLTNYFNNKYGDNTVQNDSKLWNFTRDKKKIWVSLSDKSEEYDYGRIALVIYSEDY